MPSDTHQSTPKAYCTTVYDEGGKLIAAEFVEGLPINLLDAAERWTDQGHEFRIKRVMETIDA
jgi:hypothetical protein